LSRLAAPLLHRHIAAIAGNCRALATSSITPSRCEPQHVAGGPYRM
jgi:hypothetical protein